MTITKERLLKIKQWRETYGPGSNVVLPAEEAEELARIALASLEAEPVAYVIQDRYERQNDDPGHLSRSHVTKYVSDDDIQEHEITCTPLYTAPPAPVSVPTFDEWCELTERKPVGWVRDAMKEAYDACRAAMLQGADGKPELTVWYGAMPETNGKTNWTAMLHREGQHPWEGITIDRSEYPGRVRYEADRMRHLIGELADEPDILAYDAEAHSGYVYPGNSPVIPDGWVMLPAEPTQAMMNAWLSEVANWRGHAAGYRAMIAAAPQQEAKNV